MAENITLLLLGVGAGSLIALSALGLVLMYRSSGVVNFATGGIGMACSYVLWDLTHNAGWSALPAGFVAVVIGAALGVGTYVLVMVLPRASSNLTRVVATLAVLIILESVAQLRYGPTPLSVNQFLSGGSANFGGGIVIPTSRLILVGVALILTLALSVIYARTMFGLATTALSERRRTLAALGWRIGWVGAVNWGVGGALAGLAGVLLAPIIGVAIGNGTVLTVAVLAAALIGGLRSFPLTLAGGMVIGMLQSLFGIHDLGVPGLADAVPFVAIIAVIVVRGRRLPLRSFVGERLPRVGSGEIRIGWVLAGAAVVVALIGWVLNDNGTSALTISLLAAIPLLSLTVLLGYAGQMSLAQVTLSLVGGLIAARLAANVGLPFPIILLLAMLGTVPVGLIVGLPSARTRGISLAVATLGLAVAIESLVFNNDSISGGQTGIPLPNSGSFKIFGVDFDSFLHVDRFAYLVLGFVLVLAVLVANLRRSASGRRMIAVRGNERAAAGLGVNVVTTKLWAFALAAAITGLGGALAVYSAPAAIFTDSSVLDNLTAVGYSIVGGAGSVVGALLASTLEPAGIGNAALDSIFGIGPVTMALIGGVLLLFTIITQPDGIAAAQAEAIGSIRRRLPRRRAPAERLRQAPVERDDLAPERVRPATLSVAGIEVLFGAVRAVGGVDLSVEPGEVVGVVGANGAGKTTLIDAITGFVPSAGTVDLGGQDLSAMSAHGRARAGLARSWQSLELIEDLSVLDNLRTASDSSRWWSSLVDLVRPGRDKPTAAMLRAIQALDLDDVLGKMPTELSTGKRKLVALARAIASGPSVILLDEPCSGLDHHERQEVGSVIRTLAERWGVGVLLVEHDVHLVRRVSDRIVALDFGKVIAEGPPDRALSDRGVMAAFLGEVSEADRGKVLT
ncbi:MAG TPA: ATP-binding cassette domain-containing protein [Solirubrobacteraceae bacterium]|nr:ATP-binding cassette domain-containing protein [Solirubrobacteraceae bacterium]